MTAAGFRATKGGSDLNGDRRFWQSSGFSSGDRHEHRQNAVRSTHGQTFHRIVDRCDGDRYVKSMTCADQFRVMAFAQLTYRESLRDIDVCLSAQSASQRMENPATVELSVKAA